MKILTALKILFLIGCLSIVLGDAFILVNFFAGSLIPPVLIVVLVSVGLAGIISGIVWYTKKEKQLKK
ncbi:MAG: hypothetical protein IJX39_05155 [Clostridia bacterium]|nr:hypothetical protein [Clostridia bacterium]